MKRTSLLLLSILSASRLFADPGQHIIPAGSLIGCTLAEPKLSSKTTAIGDPVLCTVGHAERYGRSVLPYNSYLVGRFEDFKDPGHFIGKGWMQLRFDRMVIEPDVVVPVDARVVAVPGYQVDNQGRILGKGHAVRDAVLWSIPILWPLDLVMLPARGPRPVLKEETHLTLKVMDDLAIPDTTQQPIQDSYGLSHRLSMNDAPQGPAPDPEPSPDTAYAPMQDPIPPQMDDPAPPPPQPSAYAYAPPPPPVVAYAAPVPVPYGYGYAPSYGPGYGVGFGFSGGGYAARPYAARPYGYSQGQRYGYPGGRGYPPNYGPRGGVPRGNPPARPAGGYPGYRGGQGGRPGMQAYGGGRPGGGQRASMGYGGYRR